MECESKHKEIQWTSSKLLEYFNVEKNSKIAQSTQLEATHMILRKTIIQNIILKITQNYSTLT